MWIGNTLDHGLPVRPAPRKVGCDSSSLSYTCSLILLNQICVWICSVSAAVSRGGCRESFLPDRYHSSLLELKCCSCKERHATARVGGAPACCHSPGASFTVVEGFLAATVPDPTQVPSAAAGSWQLSAPPTLPQFRNPLCPSHYRILLPTVQAPELLGTRTAHFSNSALHNAAKGSNESPLILSEDHISLLSLSSIIFPPCSAKPSLDTIETGAGNPNTLLMQPKS